MLCYADFNIYRSSRRKCFTYVLNLNGLLSICVGLRLSVLLVIRVLKCFVTPSLTYTAQVEESDLHISFESHWITEYMS